MFLDPLFLQNEWVLCRVFQKSPGGKKIHISEFSRCLPPLMDSSPPHTGDTSHVTCFSDPVEDLKPPEMIDSFTTTTVLLSKPPSLPNSAYINQLIPNVQYSDSFWMQDQSMFPGGGRSKQNSEAEFSTDSVVSNPEMIQDHNPLFSAGPVDLGCLWSY